jgi:hypothetical protein
MPWDLEQHYNFSKERWALEDMSDDFLIFAMNFGISSTWSLDYLGTV